MLLLAGVRVPIRVRFGSIQVFGVKDFSLIRIFLSFGSGSARIFAGSDNPLKLFLKFLNSLYTLNFSKIYKQNIILHKKLNNICQNT